MNKALTPWPNVPPGRVRWRRAERWKAAHAFPGRSRLSLCLSARQGVPRDPEVDPRGAVPLCGNCLTRLEIMDAR